MLTPTTFSSTDLEMIVAVAENGVIGNDNKLIWKLSDDLKSFRRLTTGNIIVMGRKTFDSIGKPLPNRVNIVVSRNENLKISGCEVVSSINQAVKMAREMSQNEKRIFIIGGENIYRQTIDQVSAIYYTKVYATPEGDAFFPELSAEWKETERTRYQANEKNEYDFDVIKLVKVG